MFIKMYNKSTIFKTSLYLWVDEFLLKIIQWSGHTKCEWFKVYLNMEVQNGIRLKFVFNKVSKNESVPNSDYLEELNVIQWTDRVQKEIFFQFWRLRPLRFRQETSEYKIIYLNHIIFDSIETKIIKLSVGWN